MIAAALEAEVDQYVAAFAEAVDEHGRRLVVRNGRAQERKLTVGSGTRAPRVNDKRVDEETVVWTLVVGSMATVVSIAFGLKNRCT